MLSAGRFTPFTSYYASLPAWVYLSGLYCPYRPWCCTGLTPTGRWPWDWCSGGGAIGGFIYPQVISTCIINFGGDWRVGWYVIAITCFIGAIIAMIAVRNRPEDLGQHPDGLSPQQLREAILHAKHKPIRTYRSPVNWRFRDAVKTRSLWMIVIATGFIFFLWQAALTQTTFHLRDVGFSPQDPSIFLRPEFVYGMILACSIIGRLSVSFLGERIESRFLMSIAGFSLVIGGILFWLASKDNLWAVYLFPLFTGFGFGATYVSVPLITGNYFGAGAFPSISAITNPVGCSFPILISIHRRLAVRR